MSVEPEAPELDSIAFTVCVAANSRKDYITVRIDGDDLMITLPPETEQLARLVAARRGTTPEEVLKEGVEMEARIAGVAIAESAKPRKEVDIDRVREIARDISSAPLRDTRTPKEILNEAWGSPE
jgi:hypothetical protein